jgi:cobalt-zinc-cadmium resistance protein CzcA
VNAVLESIPRRSDAKVEQTEGLPVMTVEIDRPAAARTADVADVQEVVAVAMGGREAGLVFEGDRASISSCACQNRCAAISTPGSIADSASAAREQRPCRAIGATIGGAHQRAVRWQRADAGFIPLGAVAKVDIAEGLNQISRENGKRGIVVQCNVRGRDLGSFVEEAQERMKASSSALANGSSGAVSTRISSPRNPGSRSSSRSAFALIFMLLFSTFGSSEVRAARLRRGARSPERWRAALWLREMPFSISAAVGFIALSGVAVLNGLVMVSYINQLRGEGRARDEAITRGSLTRLRPVLMTALVASLGFVPMALATGTGAEVQKPLGDGGDRRVGIEHAADVGGVAGAVSDLHGRRESGRATGAELTTDGTRGPAH